tara:strand:+ start:1511 stop:2164 length:654 start_codon:yes stop_codon:yes gene_type:complete
MFNFNIARKNMVKNQLMTNNINENNILKAFESIPRENFLPFNSKLKAYFDEDIEIINNRFLLEPRVIANIIKLSKINKFDIVMDYPCSTGYTSCLLSKLCHSVYAIDNKINMISSARNEIRKLNINNINLLEKKYLNSLKIKFDIIFIFGGVQYIPSFLLRLLKPNTGRLITIIYKNNIGKINIVKNDKNIISNETFFTVHTPILNEFINKKKVLTL